MTDIFSCTEDNDAPEEIKQAGVNGELQVKSCIGWIDLTQEEYTYVKNGCEYRIKSGDLIRLIDSAMNNAFDNGFDFHSWTYQEIAEDLTTCDSALEEYSPDEIEPVLRKWYSKQNLLSYPKEN